MAGLIAVLQRDLMCFNTDDVVVIAGSMFGQLHELRRQGQFWVAAVGAVEAIHLANGLNQGGACVLLNGLAPLLSLVTIGAQFDFDQFMVIQGLLNLSQHGVNEAAVGHSDYRLEVVAQAAQVAFLWVTQSHGLSVPQCMISA